MSVRNMTTTGEGLTEGDVARRQVTSWKRGSEFDTCGDAQRV